MSEQSWNNTNLSLLEQCPERFRRRVVEGERVPATVRMRRGSAFAEVTREAHRRQYVARALARGEQPVLGTPEDTARVVALVEGLDPADVLPGDEEVADLAATRFREEVEGGVTFTEDEAGERARVLGREKDFVVRGAKLYVRHVAPRIRPVSVERKITVRPKDSDVTIHGRLDLVEELPPENPFVPSFPHPQDGVARAAEAIRDGKTAERKPSRDLADRSQQLSVYAMLRLAETGKLPAVQVLDYVVRTPGRGDMSYVPLVTTRDRSDVEAVIARIQVAVEAVQKGVFVPTDETRDPLCSPKFCEFYATCRYVGRRRVPREEE